MLAKSLSKNMEVISVSFTISCSNQFSKSAIVKELKEIDRALILLHLEGLTGKEISKIMNITPLSVTTKVTRIKNKLKLKFDTFKR